MSISKYFYLFLDFIYGACNIAPRTLNSSPPAPNPRNFRFSEGREINRNRTNGLILYSFFLILLMGRSGSKPGRL